MIPGQMNDQERRVLQDAVLSGSPKPRVVLEVGTYVFSQAIVIIWVCYQQTVWALVVGNLLGSDWSNEHYVIDGNLYWRAGGTSNSMKFAGASLDEWRARGHDLHSLIAGPLFAAPGKYDFRLQSNSPAFKLGFGRKAFIDWLCFGLYRFVLLVWFVVVMRIGAGA